MHTFAKALKNPATPDLDAVQALDGVVQYNSPSKQKYTIEIIQIKTNCRLLRNNGDFSGIISQRFHEDYFALCRIR